MSTYLKISSTAILLCVLCGCAVDTTTHTDANTSAAASINGGKVSVSSNGRRIHYSKQQGIVSKGIGLSYNQVTYSLADEFNIQNGVPVNGRRSSSGQNGYKGPAIQVIGEHGNVWEAGLLVQMPNNVPGEVALTNASSLLLFMKDVSPHRKSSTDWLESAMMRSEKNPGSKITTTQRGITYTVFYVGTASSTFLTARPAGSSTDDILDAIK